MKRNLAALRDERFDLLILGGGITGAGVALDAVTRGFRVALIDKGDFASGTSSASSKLVHGGLRYLEHGEFGLVYEALHERRRLLCNAPHLVHPLRFLLPFYRGARMPPWQWRVGLTVYDLLAGRGNLRRSRPLDRGGLQAAVPGLRGEGLLRGAEYFDAQMDDARVCLEVLRSAAERGACVANYVEAVAFERTQGRIDRVQAVDRVGGETLTIRAKQVLNAAGPWVDAVCQLAGDATARHLQPTKGVHLIVPDRGLRSALLLLHPRDGRVFFVIPWSSPAGLQSPFATIKTLIGTTDTHCLDSPESIAAAAEDDAYLLEGFNHYFAPPLSANEILGRFAGLRPLVRAKPGEPSSLSREYRIFASPSGLLSVAGGKYTTYRHMAEVVTDEIVKRLGKAGKSRTADLPLDGAPSIPWPEFVATETARLIRHFGLSEAPAWHLVGRYGRRAGEVAEYIRQDSSLGHTVLSGEPDLKAEIAYQRDHEMALFPADHYLRRMRLGMWHSMAAL